MDVCPKCNEQQVMAGNCGLCGWSDGSQEREEFEALRAENEELRAQVRDYEEALGFYANQKRVLIGTVSTVGSGDDRALAMEDGATAREALARWKVPNGK